MYFTCPIRRTCQAPDLRHPLFSEYAHAMRDNLRNFISIGVLIREYPQLQGGCIWDWVDQGFAEIDEEGNKFWAFGADYGPKGTPSSGSFNCNGMVRPDRSPKAQMEEMRKVYQNIWFKNLDPQTGKVDVFNENFFIDLSQYNFEYDIKSNGKVLNSGKLAINAKPQETVTITIPNLAKHVKSGVQTTVNFYRNRKREKHDLFLPGGLWQTSSLLNVTRGNAYQHQARAGGIQE